MHVLGLVIREIHMPCMFLLVCNWLEPFYIAIGSDLWHESLTIRIASTELHFPHYICGYLLSTSGSVSD